MHFTFQGPDSMNEKPDIKQLAGIAIGDAVRLPSINCTFEVIGIPDESTLNLRSPTGREVRAGWRAVTKVPMRGQDDADE